MEDRILVAIKCLAYNHEKYLRQCLEGFVMQKTNFKFIAIVHDDASTDKSAEIIREYERKYPDIIKAIFEEENMHSKHDGSLDRIINNALIESGCKYVAWCEGDDYWTDPNKLQIQVDFLNTHNDYSMCFHASDWEENGRIFKRNIKLDKEDTISVEQIIKGGGAFCTTASLMFRTSVLLDIPKFRKIAEIGDYPLQIDCALKGKVYYFPQAMCIYRYNHPGSWTSQNSSTAAINMNDFEWLKELDRHTLGKYHKIIYNIFVHYDRKLIPLHKRTFLDLIHDLKEVCNSKKEYYKSIISSLLDVYFPIVLQLYTKLIYKKK